MSEQVVLCRPEGGFNDILCQIELCWRYADAHERVLVVDTAVTADVGVSRLAPTSSPHC